MDDQTDVQEIIQAIIEKSLHLMQRFEKNPEQWHAYFQQWLAFSTDYFTLLKVLLDNPEPVQQTLLGYWQAAMALWQQPFTQGVTVEAMPIQDKRFSADEWIKHPFFHLLSQHYLLAKQQMMSGLEQINCPDQSLAKRVQFFAQQCIDALSPDNFVQTNPRLMAETVQSQGINLLLGWRNWLSDLEAGHTQLAISMTDKNAFSVGKNIATTAGQVIYRNELMELIQYTPKTTKVKSIPLLVIPPWINKYYILDLSPHNSLIGWLVAQGITVFTISWANPDASFSQKGLPDYLTEGPMAAIRVIQQQLNVEQVNALGFCIGGTLLSMLLAYHKALNINSIRSATLLASMIDFSDPGAIGVFIDEQQIEKFEQHMQSKGYFEGDLLASAFNSLRASDLVWAFFIRNYLQGKPPVPFDLLFWNTDTTNLPAKMHSEYLRWMYLANDLVKPGKIVMNGIPLDVTRIDIPLFFVSTIKDHIAPWQTVFNGFQLMQGNKRFLLGGSGHIAGIVIPPGGEKYGYYLNPNNATSAEDWLANATHHSGSWWLEWITWLKKESGRLIKAPLLAKLPLPGLNPAPGEYVMKPSKIE